MPGNKTSKSLSKRWMQYLVALMVLASIVFSAFVVIWPYNGAGRDDWMYAYYGEQGFFTIPGANRTFGIMQTTLAEQFFPGHLALLQHLQMVNLVVAGLVLFYLARRFWGSKHLVFALVLAIVFILYVPRNPDQARSLYSASVYTWVTCLSLLSVAALVEAYQQHGRWRYVLLVVSPILAYMTVRSYETYILLSLLTPVTLLAFRPWHWRRLITTACVYYVGAGIAVLQFLIPYLSRDTSVRYQQVFNNAQEVKVNRILENLLDFYRSSFPLRGSISIFTEQNYLLPALIVALLVVLGLYITTRRLEREFSLPSLRILVVTGIVGLVYIGVVGVIFAYAGMDLRFTPRLHFTAMPGQALTVTAGIGLLLHVVYRFSHRAAFFALLLVMAVYGFLGANWHYAAQVERDRIQVADERSFMESMNFFEDVAAWIPAAAPETLIFYDCEGRDGGYSWGSIDLFGGLYLYDGSAWFGSTDIVNFGPDQIEAKTVSITHAFDKTFGYDQLVMLGCDDHGAVYVMDTLPESLPASSEAAIAYAPYDRIMPGFMSNRQQTALVR